MKVKTFAKNSLALCIAAASLSAQAGDKYWVGATPYACGSTDWNAECWVDSLSAPADFSAPKAGDDVYFIDTYSSANGLSINLAYQGPTSPVEAFNSLTIDSGQWWLPNWTLHQEGNLASHNETLAKAGYGRHVQVSGSNTITETLSIAQDSYSNGNYVLSGGTVAAKNVVLGGYGVGTFTQGTVVEPLSTAVTVSETLTIGQFYSYVGPSQYTLNNGTVTAKT